MNRHQRQQRDWLDQAIEQTRPGQPQPDYQAWSERHPQTLASLQQRASQKAGTQTESSVLLRLGRRIMQSPLTKIAAAIIAIVALLALARHLTAQDVPVTPSPRDIVKEIKPTPTPQPDEPDPAQQELQRARELYQNHDQQGLLSLLEIGQSETQITIAGYLGEIGDQEAILALQKLADTWQGQGANPYQQAIEQIQTRDNQKAKSQIESSEKMDTVLEDDVPESLVNTESSSEVTYQGYVTDEAGVPISHVRVWVGSQCRDEEFCDLSGETYTDAQGYFVLTVAAEPDPPEEIRTLFFDHSDFGIGWFQWYPLARAKEGVVFNLPEAFKMVLYPSAPVSGRVVDTMGLPIQGAEVKANLQCFADMGCYGYLLLDRALHESVLTDLKGQFILPQIPKPARMHLYVSGVGYGNYSSSDESNAGVYPIRAGEENLVIELAPATGVISGQLKLNDGEAYSTPDVVVIARSETNYALEPVDLQGRFSLKSLVDGEYWVQAFDSKKSKIPICRPLNLFVSENEKNDDVVLRILEPNPFRVTVVDQTSHQPLPDVAVYAQCVEGGDLPRAVVESDAQGQCVLQLVPGEYLIHANGWRDSGVHQFSQRVSVEAVVEGQGTTIEVTTRMSRSIEGYLVDEEGYPIPGIIQISGEPRYTDPNGRFRIPKPFGNRNEYRVGYAYDQEKQLGHAFYYRGADWVDGQSIVLKSCATITGRILRSDGSPELTIEPQIGISMPGGATTRYSSRVPWEVTLYPDGIFVFEHVPTGLPIYVSVQAEKKGLWGGIKLEKLEPGQNRDVGDIILNEDRRIDETTDWTGVLTGRITDENGDPVVGVRVKAYDSDSIDEGVTDREGRYTLKGLPKDTEIRMSLYLSGYGHCGKKVCADGNECDMQIFPQGWDMQGQEAPEIQIGQWYNCDPVTLQELRGQVVLLQIGVLLPTYDQDMQRAKQMYEKYSDQGLEVIAIHQPFDQDWAGKVTEADIEHYLSEQTVPFMFCLDKGDCNGETYTLYEIKATPAHYLIDKEGKIRVSPKREELEEWIQKLLNE